MFNENISAMKKLGMIICAAVVITTISYAQQTDSASNRSNSTGINDIGTQNGAGNQSTMPQPTQQTPTQSIPSTQDPTSTIGQPVPQQQTQPQLPSQPPLQSQPQLQQQPSLQTQPEIETQPELQVQPAQPQVPTQQQPVPNSRELQDNYNESVQPQAPTTNPTDGPHK